MPPEDCFGESQFDAHTEEKTVPNIFQRFWNASDRKQWTVLYLARKLGVNVYTDEPSRNLSEHDDKTTYITVNTEQVDKLLDSSERQEALLGDLKEQLDLRDAEPFVALSDFVVSRGTDGGSWVTHKSDYGIGILLRQAGHFQERGIDDCLGILDNLGISTTRNCFVDIGANIGTHSVRAAHLGFQKVLSLEPNPGNFKLLQTNVALNGLTDKVHCRNVAASSETGEMPMELSPINFADHRIAASEKNAMQIHGETNWDTTLVAVQTFDDVLEKEHILVEELSLVWVDTQGHEGHVLSGATKLRASGCPIVVEFWPYGLVRSGGYDQLREILSEYSQIIDLSHSTSAEITKLNLQDIDRMFNEMLSGEGERGSPHTDFLLIR